MMAHGFSGGALAHGAQDGDVIGEDIDIELLTLEVRADVQLRDAALCGGECRRHTAMGCVQL